jgi:thioredoxin-related protein
MEWLKIFDEAKEESLKSHKPILLQFEMDGCGGCKKLYEETYANPIVQEEMEKWFMLLKLDLIKEREVRRELSAYWTPSFYFLDAKGKSHFNFNGYLPADEFRIILRIGYAEVMIPKGKYNDCINVMSNHIEQFKNNPLLPKLLTQNGIANYIKSKDKISFMKTMKDVQQKFPDSLEARMYFWDE